MEIPKLRQSSDLNNAIAEFTNLFARIEAQVAQVIVGMEGVVRSTVAAIFAGGHVLLEGVPGLGKTLLVKTIAEALGLTFKRIQFTPDLMPSDITGTEILIEDPSGRRGFEFKAGPIFANVVLADEVNRATPKTQSALLEAMGEGQVTVLGKTYHLPNPFFVLATQNPIELEGTYPLPEAQLDRFLMKLLVQPPTAAQLKEVLQRTTGTHVPQVQSVFDQRSAESQIDQLRYLVRQVVVADPMLEILVRMMSALTPGDQYASPKVNQYVRFGPGPRAAQAVMMTGKVAALLDKRINLSFEDIRNVIVPALRHRIVLNFQAEADGVTADDIIREVRDAR